MNDLTIAFKLFDQVNFYWNFYVVAIIAIFGWIFSAKESWQWQKRLAVGISYLVFQAFNLLALAKCYVALEKIIAALRTAAVPGDINATVFSAALTRLDVAFWQWGLAVHLALDLIVLGFIFFWKSQRGGN